MMKRLFLFTFIFFLAFANNALAHTGLESSSPQNGDISTQELEQVTLTFETKIEQGSTFELQNSSGEAIPIENISLSENQLVGDFSDPLENGEYQVIWKIIGADGHPIDGEFSFSVNVADTAAPDEEQVEPQEGSQPQPVTDETEADTANEVADEEIKQNKIPSYVIPTVIGILIVIVAGSFLFITKRKK
ncbi:copper resistance protein CopC [Mesobacillus maritimus]|uniref:copper resistance CopC family protein n=1 Tax=Mesobacillus maritimus TaxID=1643336 RepID=UPI00203D8FC0|nr:copper resistance CopC family protein [Mesobacillus maritimus]MCM3670276.1 copper resistance protein CopC [Mesobacillus maritimus]